MNEPDDFLRAHFQHQRTRDENSVPAFPAMSTLARTRAALPSSEPGRTWLLWLAPAAVAIVLAAVLLRPERTPTPPYSDRIAALIAELDPPAFAQNTFPSDLLPTAFTQP